MKKESAQRIYDRLQDEDLDGWELKPPEYTQDRRKIRYRVRITHTSSKQSVHVPTVPYSVETLLRDMDIPNVSTSVLHLTSEDQVDDDYECDQYVRDELPRYECWIDNMRGDEIPRTAEEERIRRLRSDISQALDLAHSVNTGALAARYETVGEILGASADELREIDGIGKKTVEVIHQKRTSELTSRLEDFAVEEGDMILLVEQNEHGTYEPVFDYPTMDQINREFRESL